MSIITTAITSDGSARILFINSTDIVQTAVDKHHPSKTVTAALGRCLTATAIMGAMMKDSGGNITLRVAGNGPAGGFTCVADAGGFVRGCCDNPEAELPPNSLGKLDVGGVVGHSGDLYVVRDYGFGEPYVGYTKLVSGEIAEDISQYYSVSEQTETACALGVRVKHDGHVSGAGGYILQLLPDADKTLVPILQTNIDSMPSLSLLIEQGKNADDIFNMLFKDIPYSVLETKEVGYRCNCRRERYRSSIKAIGLKALGEMCDSGEDAEVICRFCGERYVFSPQELKQMYSEREAELKQAADAENADQI